MQYKGGTPLVPLPSYYYVQWKWNNINQGLVRCQYHVTFKNDDTIRKHREY
jgi:hypothetical protein